MKKVMIILALHCILANVNAQFSEKNAIYLSDQVALGNYLDVNINLNYVFDEKYSFQAGYSLYVRRARSQPEDYNSGVAKIFTFGISEYILDEMDNFQILVGKIYKLDESGKIRLNLAGGISYIVSPKVEFPLTRIFGISISPELLINKDRAFIGIGVGSMIGLLRNKIS